MREKNKQKTKKQKKNTILSEQFQKSNPKIIETPGQMILSSSPTEVSSQ
jgi:hypothetical protein